MQLIKIVDRVTFRTPDSSEKTWDVFEIVIDALPAKHAAATCSSTRPTPTRT